MSIYVDRRDSTIAKIVAATYPNYRGTKVQVEASEQYSPENYWSGGSRTYAVAYNLATGTVNQPARATEDPSRGEAHVTIDILQDVAIVEHIIFCGKDLGIRIIVHPDNLTPLLPALTELTERQLSILATVRCYISSYRKEVFARNNVETSEKEELYRLGYLTKQGGLTLDGKNAANSVRAFSE